MTVKAEIYDEVKRGLERRGQVTPALDRTYPLSETPAAIDYVGGGHAHRKVITI